MKKLIIISLGLFLSSIVILTSCKKDKNGAVENTEESRIHSDDQALNSDQDDEISYDAFTMVENVIALTGRTPVPWFLPPCNATITYDTLNAVRKNYNYLSWP